MQYPHEKTLNPLVPSLFIKAVQDRLRSYSGTRLREPRPCPGCGDQNYRKHNIEQQVFAVLITEDGFEEVMVEYRRYWCKNCEKPTRPDMSPLFYQDCHYGKPIVELCLFHAAENPFHASERILQNQYGLQVDRNSVQHYAERFGDEVADRYGVKIVDSTVSMNFFSLLFGVSTVDELKTEFADELADEEINGLVGVADETYPARKGAKQDLYEENMLRKQEGNSRRSGRRPSLSEVRICLNSGVSPDSSVGTQPSREGWRARVHLLLALRDSMSTFANGEPAESFAHRQGSFSFEQVLGETSTQPLPPREEEQAVQTGWCLE